MPISVLQTADVREKLLRVEAECHDLLNNPQTLEFLVPARSEAIATAQTMPPRLGLREAAGQARLLHDLGNIELQAIEMGLRTLYDFPMAPKEFREQLADIVLEEARHLRLCIDGIEQLGFQWGHVPVHFSLWNAISAQDALIDRIFIVHCYLESSGLDSGENILRKLSGVVNPGPRKIVSIIAHEELGHVRFGLNWYRHLAKAEGLEPSDDFGNRFHRLQSRLPARSQRLNIEQRRLAGFTAKEISILANSVI